MRSPQPPPSEKVLWRFVDAIIFLLPLCFFFGAIPPANLFGHPSPPQLHSSFWPLFEEPVVPFIFFLFVTFFYSFFFFLFAVTRCDTSFFFFFSFLIGYVDKDFGAPPFFFVNVQTRLYFLAGSVSSSLSTFVCPPEFFPTLLLWPV